MAKGFKNLHVRIDCADHDFIMQVSKKTGQSATKIIVKYINYLRKQPYNKRKILDENSGESFNIID